MLYFEHIGLDKIFIPDFDTFSIKFHISAWNIWGWSGCLKHQEEIKLVILDLIMVGMRGEECLQALLRIDPEVRILIMSGVRRRGWPRI